MFLLFIILLSEVSAARLVDNIYVEKLPSTEAGMLFYLCFIIFIKKIDLFHFCKCHWMNQ